MAFKIPILLLLFNRPEKTSKVFDRLREIKPQYLFVAADGPRNSRQGEAELCKKVRGIVEEVNWECDVKKLYRNENLGCGAAVSEAINWFFDNVGEGIILEDDTLPDISFFYYCEELLAKYRDSEQVMMISGDNFRFGKASIPDSYAFTRYCHVWGWATWKRAWSLYDFSMNDWPVQNQNRLLQNIFDDDFEVAFWQEIFNRIYNRLEDTWDYQWYYACWKNNGVSIEPRENLVTNIGFGQDATHTHGHEDEFIFANSQASQLKIDRHPAQITVDKTGDKITFVNRYLNGNAPVRQKNSSMISTIKHSILRTKRFLLPNTDFHFKKRMEKVEFMLLTLQKKFGKPKLPVNEDNKVYVHLGCGEIDWPKFINVDARVYKHVHYVHPVDKLPFFRNETADLIYISHCLEHIPFRQTMRVLKEWYRVLKPGGILRISVPDFELLLKIYFDNNNDMNSIILPLMGGQDYEFNFHYNVFNFESLKALLLEAGFSEARRWEYGKDEFSSLPDWSRGDQYVNNKHYKLSLNIEAVR